MILFAVLKIQMDPATDSDCSDVDVDDDDYIKPCDGYGGDDVFIKPRDFPWAPIVLRDMRISNPRNVLDWDKTRSYMAASAAYRKRIWQLRKVNGLPASTLREYGCNRGRKHCRLCGGSRRRKTRNCKRGELLALAS